MSSGETSTLYGFKFTGKATIFFKIWIVNMLLSIITFGIYSPWAKVRNNKYIYGSIFLNGIAFEYTASPIRILVGRLIVVGWYLFYVVLAKIFEFYIFALIILGIFILAIPFLVRQSICFRARYTRYQGVSFYHFGTIGQYYKYFITHFFLLILTLGLIFPYSVKQFKNLVINHTSYGDKNFAFTATASEFYKAYLKTLGVCLVPLIIFGIFVFFPQKDLIVFFIGIVYVVVLLTIPFLKGVLSGWIGNIIYNTTTIGTLTCKSDWNAWRLGWIGLSNAIVIILSLGLMYPWAIMRALRHKVEHTYIQGEGFDNIANIKHEDAKVLGEEAADFFDIDIGL